MARPSRALIIACENYLKAEDVAPQLRGTLKAATGFYKWLVNIKGLAASDIHLCCDDPVASAHPANRTYTGSRVEIVRAIDDLAIQGRDNTGELFVFFSGHGIGWQTSPQQRGLDVLLASDYRKRQISGASCIRVDELRGALRSGLGGEDHYYFLDACRTVMKVGEIEPAALGITLNPATSGEPTTYVLYSTKFGETATINNGFSDALLDGLNGVGRAKQRSVGEWWVRFERVQKFIQEHVRAKTDLAKDGTRDGLILKLEAVQPSLCSVTVEDALPSDIFDFTAKVSGLEQPFTVIGKSFQKGLEPSDDGYQFDLKANGRSLPRLDPPTSKFLDMFDPVTLRFSAIIPESVMEGSPSPSGLEIHGTANPNLEVRIQNTSTGETVASAPGLPEGGMQWIPLVPGSYVAEILEGGHIVRREQFELKPRERRQFDPLREPDSRVQRSIVARLPKSMGLPDASETLGGPIAQQDTGLWLSILGASRLIRNPSEFSKLGRFPLATFDDLAKGDSVLYALAGLETGSAAKIGVSKSAEVSWQSMEPVPEFEGLFHFRLKLTPGPHLVSFAVPGMPPVTYATYALPNRAVLMVFDVKNSGRLDARQMLLPVYSLAQYLDWKVKDRLESEQLRLVKYLVLAQERFAKRDSLEPATPEEKDRWDTMLYGKWIDPLLAIMVILEAARRGRILEVAQNMQEAITNLNRFFGELPDVSAVSRLLGVDSSSSSGTPLLLESLQRAPQLKNTLPLPASYLDYNSMWTSWFGAVKPPRWKLWWRPG